MSRWGMAARWSGSKWDEGIADGRIVGKEDAHKSGELWASGIDAAVRELCASGIEAARLDLNVRSAR